jgi:CheY-like chemotaxis protein
MRLKNKTILVADDEPGIREFIRDELEFEGAQVFEANNGAEAAVIAKTEKIDVVISDIRMPGGDGIQLLKEIKAANAHVPIVLFMTGFSDLPIDVAYQLGADAIYPKPFNLSDLVLKVVEVLETPEVRYGKDGEECKAHVEKIFSSLHSAIQSKEIGLGRGGIFLKDADAHVGEACRFMIRFESGELLLLEGVGTVRWVRSSSLDPSLRGMGIEFQYLPEPIRGSVLSLIHQLNPVAYIPTP